MKKLILPVMLCLGISAFAQEEETSWTDGFTLSGSIDAYFRQNITTLNKVTDQGYPAPGSSFANQPGFALGMANAILSYEKGNVGAVADLVYGPRGTDAVFASTTASSSIVNQLYVYWNVSESVTLTFGNWNTYLGYEVISPAANFNYSTSYMFSYGPFSHSGLKADFALDDNWSAMLAVMNATDFTDFNPSGSYTFGGQLGYSTDSGSTFLNLLYGDQDGDYTDQGMGEGVGSTFQVDLTTGYDLSDSFYLGLNATYNTTEAGDLADDYGFYGVALYAQAALSDSFSLGLRPEYFSQFGTGINDFDAIGGSDAEGDANVFAVTLSGNAKVGPLTIIPEFRLDSASEDVFLDSYDGTPTFTGSLGSFLLAAVYSF
ncbi:putative OmpL-like beta-barrel porin-2 [Leeuwenhoekiella aestuarii]|uniref:Putative OmpL-like beta-barrel porin-2 n=1 Tax=Leeuwenhoekiella aestuarii TaxID=2249426 RepID=A0A4Q0NV94_9FLAO|nr:porin [Leeuwenhoekiella aestuarii]RXG15448.1 putative OmpL-like beta-barrel porin-2 [Leeuwenhoekiella aestuarii]RXG17445.1 putative OmpL-like beta-barrel porin-2 [Leeuwenhoekiella aestuarii]